MLPHPSLATAHRDPTPAAHIGAALSVLLVTAGLDHAAPGMGAASLFMPASGVALALVLCSGLALLPGIACGMALGIAVATGLTGHWLLRHAPPRRRSPASPCCASCCWRAALPAQALGRHRAAC